jgi:hypothetical protein
MRQTTRADEWSGLCPSAEWRRGWDSSRRGKVFLTWTELEERCFSARASTTPQPTAPARSRGGKHLRLLRKAHVLLLRCLSAHSGDRLARWSCMSGFVEYPAGRSLSRAPCLAQRLTHAARAAHALTLAPAGPLVGRLSAILPLRHFPSNEPAAASLHSQPQQEFDEPPNSAGILALLRQGVSRRTVRCSFDRQPNRRRRRVRAALTMTRHNLGGGVQRRIRDPEFRRSESRAASHIGRLQRAGPKVAH